MKYINYQNVLYSILNVGIYYGNNRVGFSNGQVFDKDFISCGAVEK